MARPTVTRYLFVSLIAILMALSLPAAPAAASPRPADDTPAGPVVARVFYKDKAGLDRLFAEGYDVWEEHVFQDYVTIPLQPADWQKLSAAGYTLKIDEAQTDRFNTPFTFQGGYLNVEEIYSFLNQTVATYPAITQLYDFGDSWQKVTPGGNAGYDLLALRITNRAIGGSVPAPGLPGLSPQPTKPVFFLMADIHARELATPELARRFVEWLVYGYGNNADATWLVDYHEIWVVLTSNPDGYKVAENPPSGPSLYQRKNTNNTNGGSCSVPPSSSNQYGTDLNRNANFQWGGAGTSTNPCNETYRGPTAASEPEALALQNLMAGLFQDQRGPNLTDPAPATTNGAMITLHSYGELVLWPWGSTSTPPPNSAQLQQLGQKFATYNGYTPEQSVGLYPTTGTTDDWAYGILGVAAYTFEVGTAFFQPYADIPGMYAGNGPALIYAAKAARYPYQVPAGPDSLSVAVSPALVNAGDAVTLNATINDSRNGNNPVSAASYWIDTPDWAGAATAHPMTPSDGTFNTAIEGATATIDSTGLTGGRHMVFVRGQDNAGNWGPVTAAFLYIATGNEGAVAGTVTEMGSGHPLAATVTVLGPNVSTTSNPVTGFYRRTSPAGTYSVLASATGHDPLTVPNVTISDFVTTTVNFQLAVTPPQPGDCSASQSANLVYSNGFETGTTGWSHSGTGDSWALSNVRQHSGVYAWNAIDPATISDQRLVSPPVVLPAGESPLSLKFWNYQSMENRTGGCYDGGILEITTNGGSSWAQVTAGLLTDPYDGPVSTSYGNPLGNVNAWCGAPQDWLNSIVDLNAYAGQTVQFRFRLGSDNGVGREGWYIDDVVVQSCRVEATCFWADPNCSCNEGGGTIDINDIQLVANAWNDYQGAGTYSQAGDVNCRAAGGCDGVNDIKDVQTVASMFATSCPLPGETGG